MSVYDPEQDPTEEPAEYTNSPIEEPGHPQDKAAEEDDDE